MRYVAGNRAILNHARDGKDLHLFKQAQKGHVRYVGQVICTGSSYKDAPDAQGHLRKAIVFELTPIAEDVGGRFCPSSALPHMRRPCGSVSVCEGWQPGYNPKPIRSLARRLCQQHSQRLVRCFCKAGAAEYLSSISFCCPSKYRSRKGPAHFREPALRPRIAFVGNAGCWVRERVQDREAGQGSESPYVTPDQRDR
jgi:5-methylcytosine-specific restriction protein A